MPEEKPQVETEDGLKMFLCEMETRFSMIVLAENKESAEIIAEEWSDEEYKELPLTDRFTVAWTRPITGKDSVPPSWLEGRPYYEEPSDDRTVAKIIGEWEKRK